MILPVRLEKVQPLRHNILWWLDEKGETHRRMLWHGSIKAIGVYPIFNGIVNIVLCLSFKSGEKPCFGNLGNPREPFSMPCLGDWLSEKEKSVIALAEEGCSGERDFTKGTFGQREMRYPPLGLSGIKLANTSAPRRRGMDRENGST